jgi:hypothetical protein
MKLLLKPKPSESSMKFQHNFVTFEITVTKFRENSGDTILITPQAAAAPPPSRALQIKFRGHNTN